MFENRVLNHYFHLWRKISAANRRKDTNAQGASYFCLSTITEWRKIKWPGHGHEWIHTFTWQTWSEGATSKTLVMNNNIEMDHTATESEEQTGFIWQWTLVNTVMNCILPPTMQHFLTSWVTTSFSRRMLLHGPSQWVNLTLSQLSYIYITKIYHLSITHSTENAW